MRKLSILLALLVLTTCSCRPLDNDERTNLEDELATEESVSTETTSSKSGENKKQPDEEKQMITINKSNINRYIAVEARYGNISVAPYTIELSIIPKLSGTFSNLTVTISFENLGSGLQMVLPPAATQNAITLHIPPEGVREVTYTVKAWQVENIYYSKPNTNFTVSIVSASGTFCPDD